jgi:hypothetical protein
MNTLPEVIAKHIDRPGQLYQLIDRYQQASAAAWLAVHLGELLPGLAADLTAAQLAADEAAKAAQDARARITQIEAQMASQAPQPAPGLAEDRHRIHLASEPAESHARSTRGAATEARARYDVIAALVADLETVTLPTGDEARQVVTAALG